MPPKGWKSAKLVHSLLDAAEWKRLFFDRHEYLNVEELVDAAGRGGMAQEYLEAFVHLGHRPRKRRTVTDIVMAHQRGEKPHWLEKVLSGLWLLYCTERTMWKDAGGEETSELTTATRSQRHALRGTGWVRLRRPKVLELAERRRSEALQAASGEVFMLWVDNYNKFRYSRNPNEDRDRCVNCTVFAMLPLRGVDRHVWRGWPSLGDISGQLPVIGRQMVQHQKEFNDRVRSLYRRGLRHEHVRVPCDLRRFGVTTTPWTPFQMLSADIKSTDGLVDAMLEVLRLQSVTCGLCCVLADVNIFWRVIRLVYCVQYAHLNIRGELAECMPVLGIWHAYAHAVKKVYEHFLPWWAALEIPGFLQYPEESTVYSKPRLIVIEHLVMGLFLAGPQVEADIRRTLQQARERFGEDSQQVEQCLGLLYLTTEYCPALVEMGIAVRQCFWATKEANTGLVARSVIRDGIVLLHSLSGGRVTEYVRNLVLMDILWVTGHSSLPATAFVEECLESSLSVLGQRKQTDTRAHTVEDFSNMYTRPSLSFLWGGGLSLLHAETACKNCICHDTINAQCMVEREGLCRFHRTSTPGGSGQLPCGHQSGVPPASGAAGW